MSKNQNINSLEDEIPFQKGLMFRFEMLVFGGSSSSKSWGVSFFRMKHAIDGGKSWKAIDFYIFWNLMGR